MTTYIETTTDASAIPTHWPPVIHIVYSPGPVVRPGDRALCGVRMMGVTIHEGVVTCARCAELDRS